MVFVRAESKKFRRFVVRGIKSMEVFALASRWRRLVFLTNKSKLREKFSVKIFGRIHVFHSEIDVIEQSRFHHFDFRFSRRIINFNPDQVSSIAQTLMSTKSSGRATARITSSVISVATPEDFFGQEAQSTASSAIFRRKIDN